MNHVLSSLVTHWEVRKKQNALSYVQNDRVIFETWQNIVSKAISSSNQIKNIIKSHSDPIMIIANTRPEWLPLEIAIGSLNVPLVSISPSISNTDLSFILSDCNPLLIIAENENILSRDPIKNYDKKTNYLCFENLILNSQSEDLECINFLKHFLKKSKNNQLNLIYTSGTSGIPKAVIIDQDNIYHSLTQVFEEFSVDSSDTSIIFLPLSHVLGKIEIWGAIHYGYTLGFASSIEKMKTEVKLIKPTIMLGVPRIFEKIYTGLLSQVLNKKLPHLFFQKSISIFKNVKNKKSLLDSAYITASSLIAKKILKNKLGGRLRFAVSGGSHLSDEITHFFEFCGIPLYQGYGLTETTGPVTVNTPFNNKIGSVGKVVRGMSLKINSEGEILVRGSQVVKKYLNENSENKLDLDPNGFLKTGDIGKIDDQGFLFITDRKKDLIKTSGGKFVAPQKIQTKLKVNPIINHVFVYGDEKKYVVALITIDTNEYYKFCESLNIDPKTPISKNINLLENIRTTIAELNRELSSYETIKNFRVLDNDFTVESGELTNSLKIKRQFCTNKYKALLDELY